MIFHTHDWENILVTQTEPKEMTGDYSGPAGFVQKIRSGLTIVLFKCTDPKCGKTQTVEMLGQKVWEK